MPGILRSKLLNYRVFKSFFPVQNIFADFFTLPFEYYFGNGKSSRLPVIINFNPTKRCNQDCWMCLAKNMPVPEGRELSLEEIKNILHDISGKSFRKISFFLTGGEPFLRSDILEIIEEIKKHGFACGMVTNATLLDGARIKRLVELKIDNIIFSFHGLEQAHDNTVRVKGAFSKAMQSLRMFDRINRGSIPVIINYVVSPASLPDMEGFIRLIQELRINFLRYEHLAFLTKNEIAKHKKACEKLFPLREAGLLCCEGEPLDGRALCGLINTAGLKWRIPVVSKPVLSAGKIREWYSDSFQAWGKCAFVWRAVMLDANGDVYPCHKIYYRLGNVREEGLEKIWNNEYYRDFRVKLKNSLLPGCARCCKE